MQVIKRCSIALFSFSVFVVVVDAESLPQRNYYLYVCAESDDVVEKIRFGPAGFEIIKSISVGAFPAETEGPHGISMSPDGRHWFLSIAHGMPFGSVHKFDTEEDHLARFLPCMATFTMASKVVCQHYISRAQ